MSSPERLLFLTGRLAKPRLEKVLASIDFGGASWAIGDMNVKVAALMTEALIRRRLQKPVEADRIIIPGRCRADLGALSSYFGVPFERGPDELKDLPAYFGKRGGPPDLSRYDIRIFAEIVDAAHMSVDAILAKAGSLKSAGADIIDIGCLPDTPFPHLSETIQALKARGFEISVDSANEDELREGGKAGAGFLLSLNENNLLIAEETGATPVLIPAQHGDLPSLYRACDEAERRSIRHIADPILDPIHFGFMDSLVRYAEFRRARPQTEMLMGTGNLTELTDADTNGITATLMGICSELGIRNVLAVQVSPHTRRTIQEHDAARRMMYAARTDESLPRDYTNALLSLHARNPFPDSPAEIADLARETRDDNFRIVAAEDGIHIFNRAGHWAGRDPFALFPHIEKAIEGDAAHAFYLGVEAARAGIAFELGKRYAQDTPVDWGVAADRPTEDLTKFQEAGATLHAGRTVAKPGAEDDTPYS